METTEHYYQKILKETLSLRQRQNPHYSLRAFSRDLGIHPGTLGKVIKGERPLPLKTAKTVLAHLKLKPQSYTLFMESLLRQKTNIDDIRIDTLDTRFIVEETNYKVIAEWEHFVVTDLYDVVGFMPVAEDISHRLGISKERAEVVISNLLTSGLLKRDENGVLQRVHADIKTTEDMKSQALRESHMETLKIGIEKLNEIEVELRDFSSSAMAIDLDQLPEAKTIIREFRQKMAALLRNGKMKTDVFQLAIQFYPLTVQKKEIIQ